MDQETYKSFSTSSAVRKKRKREDSEQADGRASDDQFDDEEREQGVHELNSDDEKEQSEEILKKSHKSTAQIPSHISDIFSCVEHLHKRIKFPILPIAINQELKVIRQTLIHKWKYRYSNELDGFLYYFDNLELIDNNGLIIDDLPFIYYDITADFYVFRPKVDDYLKAKISCFEDSNKTINCSTECELTITIQLPEEISEKLNKYLKLHQEIIFLIENVDYLKMIIEGTINKRCLKLMDKHVELVSTNSDQQQNDQNESNLDDFFAS